MLSEFGALSVFLMWSLASDVSMHGKGFIEMIPSPGKEDTSDLLGICLSHFVRLLLGQVSLGMTLFAAMRFGRRKR